jgi:Cu-Zn family superoxide dismutase
MSKSTTVTAAALLVVPVALLGACSNNKPSANQSTSSSSSAAPPAGTDRITSQLRTADGKPDANATLDFANGYATVTVETVAGGILTPGFHGMHIHSVGKCDANSVAPTGGEPADFNSAGGHFDAPGYSGHPHSGDLTSLEVRPDGSAKLVTTTAAFTAADLRGGEGTALIIHQDPDNFGHIPPRYQVNGTAGPDKDTLATGDAGKRVACGVISPPSGASTSTATSTVTVSGPPPTGSTTHTTTSSSPTSTSTSSSTSTSTSTSTSSSAAPAGPPPGPGG